MQGGDWTFSESAHIMFSNMDKIKEYINTHSELNATMSYGTLDKYLDLVHQGPDNSTLNRTSPSTLSFPVVEGAWTIEVALY